MRRCAQSFSRMVLRSSSLLLEDCSVSAVITVLSSWGRGQCNAGGVEWPRIWTPESARLEVDSWL